MADRIYEGELYDQETDLIPQDEIFLVIDNSTFEKPKKMPLSMILSQAASDAILSDELLSSTGWTTTGWTGNWNDGWQHTAGNTNVLASTLAAIVDNSYLLYFVVTGRTAGSFTVAFGGITSGSQSATNSFSIVATSIGNLQITPTSDFDGTIDISVTQVNWQITQQQILDLLGVADVVESSDLVNFVEKVAGKDLSTNDFTNTYKTKLDALTNIQTVFEISLNASSDVSTRIAGLVEGTDFPTGWVLAVGTSSKDLLITHGLDRRCASVTVFAITGTEEQMLMNTAAFNGLKTPNSNSILIQSLGIITKELKIYIIMA